MELSGKVMTIKDGDIIEILQNNKPVRIRLHGVDAPEKAQAFGETGKAVYVFHGIRQGSKGHSKRY